MAVLLHGVAFERVPAIDGKNLAGLEARNPLLPQSSENISRYDRACASSHRLAWAKFLETGASHCCVLEDDVFISPEFPGFINNDSWIPSSVDLLKIETNNQKIHLSRRTTPCLNRSASLLMSRHLGAAGYIMSRKAAELLSEATAIIDRPMDYLLFGNEAVGNLSRYQLSPALCTQAKNVKNGIAFPEMESAIQRQTPTPKKPLLTKIKKELIRPLRQSQQFLMSVVSGKRFQEQRCVALFT